MSERGLADEQQAKSGKILKAEVGGSIPRKTVEVTELEVPSCRSSHSLCIDFFNFNIHWFVSEWVDHETTVLKNYTAEQEDRGPVYESEYLTLLHGGALKTVSCQSCKFKPQPASQLSLCLVGYTALILNIMKAGQHVKQPSQVPSPVYSLLASAHRHRWWMYLTPQGVFAVLQLARLVE